MTEYSDAREDLAREEMEKEREKEFNLRGLLTPELEATMLRVIDRKLGRPNAAVRCLPPSAKAVGIISALRPLIEAAILKRRRQMQDDCAKAAAEAIEQHQVSHVQGCMILDAIRSIKP